MIVECPSCSTRFNLDTSRIGERGAKVRCSVCSHAFVVHPQAAVVDESTAVDSSPAIPANFEGTSPDAVSLGSVKMLGEETQPDRLHAAHIAGTDQHRQITSPGFTPNRPPGDTVSEMHTAATTPGAQSVAMEDILEIDASEVAELAQNDVIPLDGATTANGEETPAIDAAPYDPAAFLDLEEPSYPGGRPPSSLHFDPADAASPDEIVDSTPQSESSGGEFTVDTRPIPHPSALIDYESHSTAVFNVAGLAQSAEALPESLDLERDVPGGLGPSTDEIPPAPFQSPGLESEFDGSPNPGRARKIISGLITALMLVGLAAGSVVILVRTGRLDASAIGLADMLPSTEGPLFGGHQGVFPVSVRSVLYPTRTGTELLVVIGEVENRSGEPRGELDVVVELFSNNGEVAASGRAPLGARFSVDELDQVVDRQALTERVAEKLRQRGSYRLAPGDSERFMIVVPSPPAGVEELHHQVKIVASVFDPKPATPPPTLNVQPKPETEVEGEPAKRNIDDPNKPRKRRRKRAKRASRGFQ
ncbi:MAG: zinc-ribbon domain-containing protein [Myxococcota bacterium]